MTAMWFGLALIALAGAVVLLYIDRSRRDKYGRVRQMWAKAQGYDYSAQDEDFVSGFSRGVLAKPEFSTALDVVRGTRRGEDFVLFDIEETATIVAVKRQVGSDVDIDLRSRTTPPPRDPDMELLGSIGPRVVFATDIDIARRVCDQRMAVFTEALPPHIQLLWSENQWTLGSIPLASAGREWDATIDAVARLSGMLHVLPPVTNRQVYGSQEPGIGREPRDAGSRNASGSDPRAPQPHSEPTGQGHSGRESAGDESDRRETRRAQPQRAAREDPRRDAPPRDATPRRDAPPRDATPRRDAPPPRNSGPRGVVRPVPVESDRRRTER